MVLANIRTIGAARRAGLICPDAVAAVEAVAHTGMTIDEVVAAAQAPQYRLAVLAKLWAGAWTVDFSARLSGRSVLTCGVAAG